MAIVVTETKVIPIGQSDALVFGTITGDTSYPSPGGTTVDAPGDRDYEVMAFAGGAGGHVPVYDAPNKKLKVYWTGAGLSAVLAEVTNATNLSAQSFPFIALRPS